MLALHFTEFQFLQENFTNNISISAPTDIADIVYRSVTERQLICDIATGKREFPCAGKNCILLYGDYGTGKSTLARLLPAAIDKGRGGHDAGYDFIGCGQGLNGAAIMNKIRSRTFLMSGNISGYHFIVLDEIDELSKTAQASLKAMTGIPNTIFIMTTNHIGRIDAGVQNRSVRVNCNAAHPSAYLPFAQDALVKFGGRALADDKLLPIIERCKGSVREITEQMQNIAARQMAIAVIATNLNATANIAVV